MVRPKKQSKRISCHKKYKIIKKVKEHQRKVKKEEKKKTGNKHKSKKDPGIPNLFPFKEQVLRQIEDRKQRAQEEKERRKEKRQKEVNKRRKLEDLKRNAEKRTKEYEKRELAKLTSGSQPKGAAVETSMKSYYREFKKVVDASDVVIEVLDARDPMGCRCPQLEQMIMASGTNKRLVLLLNKVDLVPRDIVEKWLKYLRHEFPALAFKASTQSQRQKLGQSKVATNLASQDLLGSGACLGAGTLLKLLGNYCRNKGIKTAITVGVVGFPNVGKSSVINSLKRSRVCTVGGTPGVTKNMQEIQLDKHVRLLDSPGIVMPTGSSSTQIILRNCVKLENLEDIITPVDALLQRCNKNQLMEKYVLPDYKDTEEFLFHFATRLGKLKKGGIPDSDAAAKAILQDWNSGKITFYTHPPERKVDTSLESSAVVQYWASEFDLDLLQKEEQGDLKDLASVFDSALVLEPGKPSEMETEKPEEEQSESEDDVDSAMEDADSMSEEENVVAKSQEEEQNVVVVEGRKPRTAHVEPKHAQVLPDADNLQRNRQNRKAFKQKQKQRKKEEAQGVAETSSKMATEDSDDAFEFEDAFGSLG